MAEIPKYQLTQTGAEVQSILDSVDDIQTDVGTLETNVGTLQDDMTTAQGNITSLEQRVTALENFKNGSRANGSITGDIVNFIRSSSCPQGITIWSARNATGTPRTGVISTVIINKPTPSGNYSIALYQSSYGIAYSNQLGTSATSLTWTEITS